MIMVKLAPFFVKAVGPSVVKLAPVALQIAVPAITNVAMPVFTKAAIAKALLHTNSVIVNAAIATTFGVGTLGQLMWPGGLSMMLKNLNITR